MKRVVFICIFILSSILSFGLESIKVDKGEYLVDLNTFLIKWKTMNEEVNLSSSQEYFEVKVISKKDNEIIFERKNSLITLTFFEDYISVKGEPKSGDFLFPLIAYESEEFILPLKNGKRVPTNDKIWKGYLEKKLDSSQGSSVFSMNLFSIKSNGKYVTYIYDNRYHNKVTYKDNILSFSHNFSKISKNNEINFKIYPNVLSIAESAKIYRKELIQTGKFKTLKEKIKENSNVEKLLGAPHFYITGEVLFSIEDIKDFNGFFNRFKEELRNEKGFLMELFSKNISTSKEFENFIEQLKPNQKLNLYEKRTFIKYFNELLYNEIFSNEENSVKTSQNFKLEIEKTFGKFMTPINYWGEGTSIEILETLNQFGIDKAWLGFHNYTMGELNPKFIKKAVGMGYLVGAYDSYKSIHLKGKEKWNTASFQDETLFDSSTITLENGEKVTGFNGFGRELNPKFSFDEVNYRLNRFSKLEFNSWFVDTDAVGEIYDDFTPGNESDEEEQVNQRIKRMDLIKDKYNLVIGSEDGDDFAAATISYAHGIFTGIVPWWIYKDMKNPNSDYFIGRYVSKDGGVPEYFEKEILLVDEADYIFYNELFNIPLYQLVYNDSVVGTNHWIFHTLKVKNRQKDIVLRGILYNVPPMYHLDRKTLKENKDKITKHFQNFSKLHRELALEEMVDFCYLTEDRLVQKTTFSNGKEIIVNFSEIPFYQNSIKVDKKSFLLINFKKSNDEL